MSMSHAPVTQLDRTVLRHLQKQSRPLQLRRIASDLRESRHRVVESLLRLQKMREVRRNARGEWIARTVATTTPSPVRGSVGGAAAGGVRVYRKPASRSSGGPDRESRWYDFRRLCQSYAECARLEERGSLEAYVDREGAQFIAIDSPLNWHAIARGTPITVSSRPDWAGFLNRVRSRREIADMVLGAPVDLIVRKDRKSGVEYRLVSPVFVTRVVVRPAGSELEIHGSGRMEVNHRWLSLRLPREDQRREFMETMGLAVTLRDDQDSDDFWEVATFDEAVRCLFERHRQWWLEFAQIDRPSRSPGFADLERPGLCNRVLLLEPPKLRYHARLHGELLRLAREITDEELDRSALRYVFPHATPPDRSGVQPSTSVPESPFEGADGVAEYALLNEDQRAACEAAISRPLTVVTGPPGTGKSLVVAHVLSNVALRGGAALFASRNHQALEAVEPRLNAMAEHQPIMLRPTRPFGQNAEQFDWFRMMTDLLAKPRVPGASERLARARGAVGRLLAGRSASERDMRRLSELRVRLAAIQEEIRQCSARCPARWSGIRSVAEVQSTSTRCSPS